MLPLFRVNAAEDEQGIAFLDHVGSGSQHHVFGTPAWVVKIRRLSLFSFLALVVSRRRWLRQVRDTLGGLVLPFLILDEVRFYGPELKTGRDYSLPVEESRRLYSTQHAIVHERIPDDTFFDIRFYTASLPDAIAMLDEYLEVLDAVRLRGFYMIDFIMRNFAYVENRLIIADPGLIVPLEMLSEPSVAITAWRFRRRLTDDFRDLLEKKVLPSNELEDRERVDVFMARFEKALIALNRRPDPGEKCRAVPILFPAGLEQEIRLCLESSRS